MQMNTRSSVGYNRKMLDGALENIVFLEMKRRGYEVYIGKNASREIDFIGVRRDEKIYIQVCVQLPENSDREIGNLMEIPDHYPKYVVTGKQHGCRERQWNPDCVSGGFFVDGTLVRICQGRRRGWIRRPWQLGEDQCSE